MRGYAVLDLETTGLHVGYHHRVVEVAVALLGEDLEYQSTWATLVQPDRDIGESTAIHGLSASLLAAAPSFGDIAAELLEVLAGRTLVAHNARFDLGFLRAEFARLGIDLGDVDALCTLQLAARRGYPTRLADACAAAGLMHERCHEASADAEAAAQLFAHLMREMATGIVPDAGPFHAPRHALAFGPTLSRPDAARPRPNRSFISTLARRLPTLPTGAVVASAGAVLEYADLLDRALEDRVLGAEEIEELAAAAEAWGLSIENVADIHRSYLTSLVAVALLDGTLSHDESRDLERISDLLAIERATLVDSIEAATPAVRHYAENGAGPGSTDSLRGKTVCFTGTCCCRIGGAAPTRAEAELLAAAVGLVVAPRVTKSLDVLVVADPETRSGKAEKARQYGTRIIAERAFWTAIGLVID